MIAGRWSRSRRIWRGCRGSSARPTRCAYAQDLKAFWEFLQVRGLEWDRLTLEQLGLFTAWLRQPADNVVLLAGAEPRRAAATVNRMLSGVMSFYDFHARHGVEVAREL